MQGPLCKLAPLLESVGLAVTEVAKDETTNPIYRSDVMDGWAGRISRFEALDPSRSSSGVVAQRRRRASVGRIQSETDHVKGECAVHTERAA